MAQIVSLRSTMQFDLATVLYNIAVFFPPFLFSICVHEAAHAWMAKRCGDRTAEHMGRLTLNPMAHADLLGTIILPLMAISLPGASQFMFGWAKPVPFDPRNLRDKKNGPMWIAAAGPISNIILAFLGAFLFVLIGTGVLFSELEAEKVEGITRMVGAFIGLNCMLAVLNLLPIHPLDGGKIVARFLPEPAARWLEEREAMLSWILLGAFLLGLGALLRIPARYLMAALAGAAGRILEVLGVIG